MTNNQPALAHKAVNIDSHLELAKWIAIITMVIDHAGFVFADKLPADYTMLRALGRLCWPLIAWIVAMRLAAVPERTMGYLKRLLPWAIFAQLPYHFVFNIPKTPPGAWYDMFNIFFTIGLGCIVFMLQQKAAKSKPPVQALLWLGIVICLILGLKVDYGPMGVVSIPLLALFAQRSYKESAIACGLWGMACNSMILIENDLLVKYWLLAVAPLACSGIALYCLNNYVALWRLPRWFFYAFYPAHLMVLICVRVWVDWDVVQAALHK